MSVRTEFDYHQPTPDQLEQLTALRGAYSALASILEQCALPSRYRSLAMTDLESSAMWANKAIVLGTAGNRAPASPSFPLDPLTPRGDLSMLTYSSDADISDATDGDPPPRVQSPPTPSHLGRVSP